MNVISKILIVDDDDVYRKVMASLLGKVGEVVAARGGFEAIKLLQAGKFDIVYSDVLMPEGTGIDLLNWVQTSSLNPKPPVILVSGQSKISTQEAMALGAFEVVGKPFRMKVLLDIFDRVREGRI